MRVIAFGVSPVPARRRPSRSQKPSRVDLKRASIIDGLWWRCGKPVSSHVHGAGLRDEIAHRLLWFVSVAFAIGAAWLLLAWITKRISGRRAALLLATEIAIVAFVLGPAFLGPGPLTLAVASIGGASTWELYGVLEKGGHAPLRWTGTVAVGLVVSVAYWLGLEASLAVAVLSGLL